MTFPPTPEQQAAIDLASTGRDTVLEAGAGCAKSTTLEMIAAANPDRTYLGIVFNKAIATENQSKASSNVSWRTGHSLAFGAVGKRYAHRLKTGRMKPMEIARILRLEKFVVNRSDGTVKVLGPDRVAGIVMASVRRFCQTADPMIGVQHVPYVDSIDLPDASGRRTFVENRRLAQTIAPALAKAWTDMANMNGVLPFSHDCQPSGTMVRRVIRRGGQNGGSGAIGAGYDTEWEDVPIEEIRKGDEVVSMSLGTRRGYVRRVGRRVTAKGSRHFVGELVSIKTPTGRTSRYTPNHICIVRLDCDLTDGNEIVYIARRGDSYRLGRTTWRTKSQNNSLGIRRRAEGNGADAIWVLSAHETASEAALAEAIASHTYNLPDQMFTAKSAQTVIINHEAFWSAIGSTERQAAACLAAHGRDIRFPFWTKGDGWETTRQPVATRACNIIPGMLVCEPDEIKPDAKGALHAHNGTGGWHPITVFKEPFSGWVYSLDVEKDHTYIADGIATHNCYFKIWCLEEPVLNYDSVFVDEAQDTNPALLGVVAAQKCQRVIVGDANQAIYEWRGAVDALGSFRALGAETATLSTSFRFGQPIADVANEILTTLGASLRLVGCPGKDGTVGSVASPTITLCRTNARAVSLALAAIADGQRVALIGGADDVVRFAEAAQKLMEGQPTTHPELACFDSWGEVLAYVRADELGSDLKVMVTLIEEYGAATIITELGRTVDEKKADVIVSTAHRSKGRQWPSVKLAGDFPDGSKRPMSDEEWRLLYVAVTRAQESLDITAVTALRPPATEELEELEELEDYEDDVEMVSGLTTVELMAIAGLPLSGEVKWASTGAVATVQLDSGCAATFAAVTPALAMNSVDAAFPGWSFVWSGKSDGVMVAAIERRESAAA